MTKIIGTLEEAKRLYQTANANQRYVLEKLFPELAESEDERISREITEFILTHRIDEPNDIEDTNSWLVWLEKKGESKLAGCEDDRIRKWLVDTIKQIPDSSIEWETISKSDVLAWLEKQNLAKFNDEKDEKIRKELLESFKYQQRESRTDKEWLNGIKLSEVVAWLEKQGEQRSKLVDFDYKANDSYLQEVTYFIPNGFHAEIDGNKVVIKRGEKKTADKVEPKFHEGDWVVYKNDICQIVKREEGCNKLVTVFGIEKELVNERNLSTARLWSIADAKAGDVLVSGQMIFVFNKLHGVWINCSCSFHKDGSFCEEDYDLMHIRYGKEVYPATKEQRDLLFQKMHEAGYMWDAENKQLLSLKAEPTGEIKGNQGKISPKWSEEDEKCIDNCCLLIGAADDCYEKTFKDDCIYYLQSLKERREQ